MSTLFSKLKKYEHELKRLETSEGTVTRIEKSIEEKNKLSLKASTSKTKSKDDDDDTSEYFSKDEEIRLFIRRYNRYMRKIFLNIRTRI